MHNTVHLALQLQRWGSLPVDQDFGEDAMSGVAIKDLLELWSAELRKAKAKLSWLIDHPSVVASAAAFLDALLGPERRKTAGCGRRPLVTSAPGASRRCWGAVTGTRMPCATLCATMRLR